MYKYPLITEKLADYKLLKQAFKIVERKEHLTLEGFSKIVAIKASMNQGLSDVLKKAFPSIVPRVRPSLVTTPEIIDPH